MDDDLKTRLLKPRLPEADVDIPGIGVVRVRGLNRAEAMHVQAAKGEEATERRILALGLIDPSMTESDAGVWQKSAPGGEIEPVSRKIAELSGLLAESAKEAVKDFEANPDAEFRDVPGTGAADDGGPAPGGDE